MKVNMNVKKIDNDGLLLCEIQAETFEKSIDKLNSSSEIFIRRFMKSKIAGRLDNKSLLDTTIQPNDILQLLDEEYGPTNYGSVKYSHDGFFLILQSCNRTVLDAAAAQNARSGAVAGLRLLYHRLPPVARLSFPAEPAARPTPPDGRSPAGCAAPRSPDPSARPRGGRTRPAPAW